MQNLHGRSCSGREGGRPEDTEHLQCWEGPGCRLRSWTCTVSVTQAAGARAGTLGLDSWSSEEGGLVTPDGESVP